MASLISLSFLVGCLPATTQRGPVVKDVTTAEAAQLMQSRPEVVVLDVRTPAEFAAGHLAGATMVDFYSASFRADVGKLDRQKAYLVYCHTGNRSAQAVMVMQQLGFREVYNMLGGIAEWQAEGRPVVK